MSTWGFCCYEDGEQTYFAHIENGRWARFPFGDMRGDNRLLALEALLPQRQSAPALGRDAVFLEALRDAALLVSLDPAAGLRCKIRADQRDLAEAVVYDLYASALPQLQFLPFAAGTELPPAPGLRLLLSPQRISDSPGTPNDLPESDFVGARVDFTAAQPTLQLNFPRLNFAQRTMRGLLAPLGLGLLLSMWNAAAHAAGERLGARRAAEYTDLTAWLMLRRSFPGNEYAVTGEEHEQLRRCAEEYAAGG
ncbi:MAG: hypothetical protein FWE98_01665 [Oscillospiraceae bacterium]|nr:hypothetical protein [Oscillospiraceae bacterium]